MDATTFTAPSARQLASRRRMAMAFVALTAFLLDWLVKSWVVARLALGESAPLWPGVAQLTYVRNHGVAFSLFREWPQALLIVGVALFGVFATLGWRQCVLGRWRSAAYGLILGGALGNLWDRLVSGSVVDYVELTVIRYPVFNLADAFICAGVALALLLWRQPPATTTTRPAPCQTS